MANYHTRTVKYKPKMTDWEAYELLGPKIRKAIQDSLQPWSAYWCLRMVRKHGADYVIAALRRGDETMMRKGFIVKRGRGINLPSSFVVCKVKPLRANWQENKNEMDY